MVAAESDNMPGTFPTGRKVGLDRAPEQPRFACGGRRVPVWVNAMRQRILAELATLRPGTTICPGELARRCGTTLRALRADYAALAAEGRIAVSQRGRVADLSTLRGPFRVGRGPAVKATDRRGPCGSKTP